MIIPDWILPLSYIGGALIAIGLIGRITIGFVRAAGKLDALYNGIPVLNEIAMDFKKNGGSSLKDAVDRIDSASIQAVLVSTEAKTEVAKVALIVKDMAEQNTASNRLLHELKGKMSQPPTGTLPI